MQKSGYRNPEEGPGAEPESGLSVHSFDSISRIRFVRSLIHSTASKKCLIVARHCPGWRDEKTKSLSTTSRKGERGKVSGKWTLGQLISVPRLHLSIPERQCSGAHYPSHNRFPRRLSLSAFPRRSRPSRLRSQSSSYPYLPRKPHTKEPFPQPPPNARSTTPCPSSEPRETWVTKPDFRSFHPAHPCELLPQPCLPVVHDCRPSSLNSLAHGRPSVVVGRIHSRWCIWV